MPKGLLRDSQFVTGSRVLGGGGGGKRISELLRQHAILVLTNLFMFCHKKDHGLVHVSSWSDELLTHIIVHFIIVQAIVDRSLQRSSLGYLLFVLDPLPFGGRNHLDSAAGFGSGCVRQTRGTPCVGGRPLLLTPVMLELPIDQRGPLRKSLGRCVR